MKDMTNLPGRLLHPAAGFGDAHNGIAVLKRNAGGAALRVMFSDGMGWDHVSVSAPRRCPTWEEMAWIKDVFFEPEECVVQFHPPRSQYVNVHPWTLHLWRNQTQPFVTPPREMVG